ncbi:MAG: hypothetical protein K0R51_798 [Cytophagaceae bacterium]|nr:hypothetical protein [Cytophagaceae bacterium]
MKKKVAIQTFKPTNNYGGILQAFALQRAMESLGCEVTHLNRYNKPQSAILRIKIAASKLVHFNFHRVSDKVLKKYTQFIDKRINLSKPLLSKDKWEQYIHNNNFDAVIVGSDQVWRLEYITDLVSEFFLDFSKGKIKKASYASSFGIDTFDPKYQQEVKNKLKDFDSISVREDAGLKIIENVFNLTGFHHLDPTLLLTKEQYASAFGLDLTKTDDFIFCYVLDKSPQKQSIVDHVKLSLGLEARFVYGAGVDKDNYKDPDVLRKPSIEQWVQNIASARFVITDSFHGMVFSIIFNKPFIVIGNEKRGLSRFTSFLSKLNLMERLILINNPTVNLDLLAKQIDYDTVNTLIEEERQKSFFYLKQLLNE